MTDFVARSKTFTGELSVPAPVDLVFPLFSPLGERAWVPGWNPQVLDPPNAEWEEEMIFQTRDENGEAVWLLTHLVPDGHRATYHRVQAGLHVVRIEVRCTAVDERRTAVRSVYRYVGLTEQGNEEIAAMTQEAYDAKMQRWAAWIGEYLKGL